MSVVRFHPVAPICRRTGFNDRRSPDRGSRSGVKVQGRTPAIQFMTYSHERIINEWLSSTMGADTVSVRFSYDYIEVYEFNGTLEQWIEVIKDQRQVWQDGEPVLKMESDWCSYARDALHLVPDHIKSELCKLHPDIEQAAACAK